MRLAGFIALLVGLALAGCAPEGRHSGLRIEGLTLLRDDAISPYPSATTLTLVIADYDKTGKLRDVGKPRTLTPTERAQFEATMSRTSEVGHVPIPRNPDDVATEAACFVPHHFFRYTDATGALIGEFSVCFCCMQEQHRPFLAFEGERQTWLTVRIDEIEAFVNRLGLPTKTGCRGFR